MTSRRKFLEQGVLGAIAAGFTLGLGDRSAARAYAPANSAVAPSGLNKAAFSAQLHTTFFITQGPHKIPIELIDVVEFNSKETAQGGREAFAVVFRGTNRSLLKQDTYSIEHEKMGTHSFLLVPIMARDKSAQYYEININRLHG